MTTRNAKKAEPTTLDDLLDFVAKTTRDHYEKTHRPIEGSLLASLFKYSYPGIDLTQFGLVKFGGLVRVAVERGMIERNPNVSHLELKPAENRAAQPVNGPDRGTRKVGFVRPTMWRALVLTDPSVKLFFRKSDGAIEAIQSSATADLRNARKNDALVEIEPVDQNMQLAWLREFLTARGLHVPATDAELVALLRGGIDALGIATAKDWRFLRSRNVVEHARLWAEKHGIDPKLVLEPASEEGKKRRLAKVPAEGVDESSLRGAILAALNEMPTSDLENLAIPLRYILRHFRAR